MVIKFLSLPRKTSSCVPHPPSLTRNKMTKWSVLLWFTVIYVASPSMQKAFLWWLKRNVFTSNELKSRAQDVKRTNEHVEETQQQDHLSHWGWDPQDFSHCIQIWAKNNKYCLLTKKKKDFYLELHFHNRCKPFKLIVSYHDICSGLLTFAVTKTTVQVPDFILQGLLGGYCLTVHPKSNIYIFSNFTYNDFWNGNPPIKVIDINNIMFGV